MNLDFIFIFLHFGQTFSYIHLHHRTYDNPSRRVFNETWTLFTYCRYKALTVRPKASWSATCSRLVLFIIDWYNFCGCDSIADCSHFSDKCFLLSVHSQVLDQRMRVRYGISIVPVLCKGFQDTLTSGLCLCIDLETIYCSQDNFYCTWSYYRPQRSCEGYVFTRVCDSVHRGGALLPGGAFSRGCLLRGVGGVACSWGCLLPRGSPGRGVPAPGGVACSWGGLLRGVHAPGGVCSGRGYLLLGGCGNTPPPPESRRLLFRTVRILLECILILLFFLSKSQDSSAIDFVMFLKWRQSWDWRFCDWPKGFKKYVKKGQIQKLLRCTWPSSCNELEDTNLKYQYGNPA